jgi:hypothetical protein
MQYQVPQFIEVENKIVGPLTLKQFFYIAAAFFINFASFFVLQAGFWLVLIIIVNAATLALAFIKINGQPLLKVVVAAIRYFWKPRLYVWQKTTPEQGPKNLDELELRLKTSTQAIGQREKGFRPSIFAKLYQKGDVFEILRKVTGQQEAARRVDYR